MNIQQSLIDYTIYHPRLEQHRNYIGLSGIGDCPRVLYDKYMRQAGNAEHSPDQLLIFYMGYAMEDDIVARLKAIGDYQPGFEISLYDGLVKGHTDGVFNGDLLEVKSVALAEYLPKDGKLPRRVSWQVQAYLTFGQTVGHIRFERAQVVYVARENGEIVVISVKTDREMAGRIRAKLVNVVGAVKTGEIPQCECRRC
jgi:hypothetical protein